MFATLFESRERKRADANELDRLATKYGDELVPVLHECVSQPGLSARERDHWKRILRKVR